MMTLWWSMGTYIYKAISADQLLADQLHFKYQLDF